MTKPWHERTEYEMGSDMACILANGRDRDYIEMLLREQAAVKCLQSLCGFSEEYERGYGDALRLLLNGTGGNA